MSMSFEKEEGDLTVLLSLLEENDCKSINKPLQITQILDDDEQEGVVCAVAEDNNCAEIESHCKPITVNTSNFSKDQISEITRNGPVHVDPLERELLLMEERMKKLKEEISKKKTLKSGDNKCFTRLSAVINGGGSSKLENSATTTILSASEREKLLRSLDHKKSEIHTGDTDSEDEEDNRAPLEAQLSSYGRQMKKRIAHLTPEIKTNSSISKNQHLNGWKGGRGGSLLPMGKIVLDEPNVKHSSNSTNTAVDPFSGIKIINPLVSVDAMKKLMTERRMIQMSAILSCVRGGEIEGDWVTIGVIVSKSETKTSQKGNHYSVWQMSDLKDCTKVVSLFLFTRAYESLWKTTIGSVVGILNPQIMKESNKQIDGRNCLTLSVNTDEKVLLMGVSKDLGWCTGRNKQGSNCRQFVNKNVCEVCIFHIQREYQKMSSKRAEIQSSFARVDPRKSFQKRVLGKNQVFYGGQMYCSSNVKRASPLQKTTLTPESRAKDLTTLSSLTMKLKAESLKEKHKKNSFTLRPLTEKQIDTVKNVTKDNEELGQMLLTPTPGARNLLLHKTKVGQTENTPSSGASSHPAQRLSAKEFLSSTASTSNCIKVLEQTANKTPLLGRGLGPGKDFEIEVSSKFDPLKEKALSIMKKQGGIRPLEKNMKRNKERVASAHFQTTVQKRLRELPHEGQVMMMEATSATDENPSSGKKPKEDFSPATALEVAPQKSLLGSVDINSEKFLSMMKAKSSHISLLQAAEDEEVEKYYNSLEKKEMLENKMTSIMEVPCKAVVCLQCKYRAMSAADYCRKEIHSLKIIQATKRFFECRNCKRRTISLNKLPGKPCSHCSQSSWRRVALAKEKHGPKLESEILSLRGDELSHMSSSSNQVYINL